MPLDEPNPNDQRRGLSEPIAVEPNPLRVGVGPSVGDEPASRPSSAPSASGFLIALVLLTAIPLIGMPLAVNLSILDHLPSGIVPLTLLVVLITGPIHVASTIFFYFDGAFRPVIRENPFRCLWSPAAVPLALITFGSLAAIFVGAWGFLFVYAYHNVWLFYHYQRQNFGLISFISKYTEGGPLSSRINAALNTAAIGGVLCLLGSPGFYQLTPSGEPLMQVAGLVTADLQSALRLCGTLVYALSIPLMIAAVMASGGRLRSNVWVLVSLLVGLLFFLPPVLSPSLALGFLPLAIAHGSQYLLMMGFVSARSSFRWIALVGIAVLSVGVGVAIQGTMSHWPVVLIGIGLVQVHFLVDSRVWRLREPRQRAIMSERFDFLLRS